MIAIFNQVSIQPSRVSRTRCQKVGHGPGYSVLSPDVELGWVSNWYASLPQVTSSECLIGTAKARIVVDQ